MAYGIVPMAYGIVHQFPGGTKEQYEASIAAVHPSDGGLPDLPRSRAVGRWLDHHRDSRLAGKLGALPRRETDANDRQRH